MSLLDRLPHTATAKRRKRTKDPMGGLVDTYPTIVFSDRACWRQALSDSEVSYWMKKSQDITHKVFFASDPGLDEGCVLEIDGDVLDVVSASNPDASAGLGYLWRVNCKLQS